MTKSTTPTCKTTNRTVPRTLGLSRWLAGWLLGAAGAVCWGSEPTPPVRPELVLDERPLVPLEAGWRQPPPLARTQCWWWWLNGNVTRKALTQDLEAMKAQGIGGANIIDAGGASQNAHDRVPHGPDFATPAWRELFRHAVDEADRLGLELGFNIQSGWNLGGPTVPPQHAAKKLTWVEATVLGGRPIEMTLPRPPAVDDYYRDVALLAVPLPSTADGSASVLVSADSAQPNFPPVLAVDDDPETFWVSGTTEPGTGPSAECPVLYTLEFSAPVAATRLTITPRPAYGPKRGWLQRADNPQNWRVVTKWTADARGPTVVKFPRTRAKLWRLVIVDAHDPHSPLLPRNAQIAELELHDRRRRLTRNVGMLARIDNFRQKAYHDYPGAFTAARAEHLLDTGAAHGSGQAIERDEVRDISRHLSADGALRWNAPPGNWKLLRFGYTLSGARVSTSSDGWDGWAIDYLDPEAFDTYWQEVVAPLLADVEPHWGGALKYLHTDSWELGPVNWTARMQRAFSARRGYRMAPYLPTLAGYVVGDRLESNRFLNDFRRTIADLIADGKYATFRDRAHAMQMGIHPESGGPHAAPIDALKCLGRSDIPMGEFWARSDTHRVRDSERLFTKQAASAAATWPPRPRPGTCTAPS